MKENDPRTMGSSNNEVLVAIINDPSVKMGGWPEDAVVPLSREVTWKRIS